MTTPYVLGLVGFVVAYALLLVAVIVRHERKVRRDER